MWQQLTPGDIQKAKSRLTLKRAETLTKHAQEMKSLEAEQEEIETLERLVTVFAQKYITPEAAPSGASAVFDEQPAPAVVDEPRAPEVQQEAPASSPEVYQNVSPNFGGPLRRFVGR